MSHHNSYYSFSRRYQLSVTIGSQKQMKGRD